MRRAIELAARGLATVSPNPVVGCVILDAAGSGRRRGLARLSPAGRTPRSSPCRRQAPRPRRDGCRHPRALLAHRPHRCVHDALLAAGSAGWSTRSTIPNPAAAAAAQVLRAAPGSTVEGGLLAGPRPSGQRGLAARRPPRPALRDLEVRREPRRPDRGRRRQQPLDHRPAGPRWTCIACVPRSTRSLVGVALCVADDPRSPPPRAARAAAPSANRCASSSTARGRYPPRRGVRDDSADDAHHRRPRRRRCSPSCTGPGVVSVLLEGGPDPRRRILGDGLIDKVVGYLSPVLLGSGSYPALARCRHRVHRQRRPPRLDDVTRFGSRFPADSYPLEVQTPVFTGSWKSWARSPLSKSSTDAARITVLARVVGEDVGLGDSISVNGVCLTVTG